MNHELHPEALKAAAISIAADTPVMQMHRSSEIAGKAVVAYLAALPPADDELVARFNRQVEIALAYAQDEKPKHEKLIASVFELQVGHLRDIFTEEAARITSLTAEVERLQNEVESHVHAELVREASLTAANELLAEAEKVIKTLTYLYVRNVGTDAEYIACITPHNASEMTAEQRASNLTWKAWDDARALSQRLAGRVK